MTGCGRRMRARTSDRMASRQAKGDFGDHGGYSAVASYSAGEFEVTAPWLCVNEHYWLQPLPSPAIR
jgi:hypothetical protein